MDQLKEVRFDSEQLRDNDFETLLTHTLADICCGLPARSASKLMDPYETIGRAHCRISIGFIGRVHNFIQN